MIIKREIYIIHYTFYNYLLTFIIHLFIYTVTHLPRIPEKKRIKAARTPTLPFHTMLFKSKHHKDSYAHISLKYTMETYIIQLVKKAKTFHPRHPSHTNLLLQK